MIFLSLISRKNHIGILREEKRDLQYRRKGFHYVE